LIHLDKSQKIQNLFQHFLVLTSNPEKFDKPLVKSDDGRMIEQIEKFLEEKPPATEVQDTATAAVAETPIYVPPKWKNPWEQRERFDPYPNAFTKWLGKSCS
jgi:hypothetical protein